MKDNKLIAEFMGLPLVPCSIGTENGIVYEGYQHPKEGMPSTADGLQYKYSWDWLMPVVQKVSSLCDEPCELDNMKHALLTGDIESVYDDVVEFIKQYDNQRNAHS